MLDAILGYLAGLPAFIGYFATSLGLTGAYALAYTALTPHHEWRLIRANVPAAALAFGGSLIGFVLPLASAIVHSVSLLDCLSWGVVALVAQLSTFGVLRLLLPKLPERIANNELASGIFVACASVAVGLLNAASMVD